MAGYIAFTGMSEIIPWHVSLWNIEIYFMLIIATIFFGFFNATMILSWNIGSSYFGSNEQAGDYQSIHLFATGLRGALAPIIGIALYEWFGFSWTFGVAVFMLFVAIGILRWSFKNR